MLLPPFQMGKRQNKLGQMCDVLETVWSEPGSPVNEQPPHLSLPPKKHHQISGNKKIMNMNGGSRTRSNMNTQQSSAITRKNTKAMKSKAFFAALDNMLSDSGNGDSPDGDPDEFFLLPDRVLGVDSLTFREELAAVAPAFLSPVTPTTPSVGGVVVGNGFGGINGHHNNIGFGGKNSSVHSRTHNGYSHSAHLPHKSSSLDSNRSTDSNRSNGMRLVDDTEGLIITRACNGCLWLCK